MELAVSLRPLKQFMGFLGLVFVPEETIEIKKKLLHYVIPQLSTWLLNVVINSWYIYHNYFCQSWTTTTSETWNRAVDYAMFALFLVGGHSALLFACNNAQWNQLWAKLHALFNELDMKKCKNGLREIQKFSLFGVLYLIMSILFDIAGGLLVALSGNETRLNFFLTATSFFTYCYPTSGLILLSLVCQITSVALDGLADALPSVMRTHIGVTYKKDAHGICEEMLLKDFSRWKLMHSLVVDCVEAINKSLGPMIFIVTVVLYVNFVTSSFYIVIVIQETLLKGLKYGYKPVIEMFISCKALCQFIVYIMILTLAGTRLENSANNLSQVIRRHSAFKGTTPLHNLISQLCKQVHYSKLRITALGFCEVDVTLIPMIIEGMITYLVIFYQFHDY